MAKHKASLPPAASKAFGLTVGSPIEGLVQIWARFLLALDQPLALCVFVRAYVCKGCVCVCARNQTDNQHLTHSVSGTAATTAAPLIDYYLGQH